MDKKFRMSFRQRVYRALHGKKTLLRYLICIRTSFREVFCFLNPGTDFWN